MLMLFNAWRLNAMRTMSAFVLSDKCNSRKQLLAARNSKGKTYAAFLQMLFDKLEMPSVLRCGGTVGVDDLLSPQRPKTSKRRVTYNMWAEEDEWITFRTTPHSGHVPSHIPTLVEDAFLPPSAGKRKRGETDEDTNNEVVVNTAEGNVDVNAEATPVKRLLTDGSGASVVPTGSASEAMNQIEYGRYLELVVQSQRRQIDFV
jgi:hypothetical protein